MFNLNFGLVIICKLTPKYIQKKYSQVSDLFTSPIYSLWLCVRAYIVFSHAFWEGAGVRCISLRRKPFYSWHLFIRLSCRGLNIYKCSSSRIVVELSLTNAQNVMEWIEKILQEDVPWNNWTVQEQKQWENKIVKSRLPCTDEQPHANLLDDKSRIKLREKHCIRWDFNHLQELTAKDIKKNARWLWNSI